MGKIISESRIDRNTLTAWLKLSLDGEPNLAYYYNHSTEIITSPANTTDIIIDYANWKELLDINVEWTFKIKNTFKLLPNPKLFLHKTEYEVKANEISFKITLPNNDIILDIVFDLSHNIIIVKPRVEINLNFYDFLFWQKTAIDFRALLAKRGY